MVNGYEVQRLSFTYMICFNFMVNSLMTNMFWAQSYDSSVRFNVNTEGLLSTMPAPLLPATEGLLTIVLYSVYQHAEEVLMRYRLPLY